MNRTVIMTLGFLLVFFGIQLNIVDSYVLTPRMANFLSDQFAETPAIESNAININPDGSPFVQAGFANDPNSFRVPAAIPANPSPVSRVIRPPSWIGWPIMFLGAVFFLNGVTIRK